MKERDEEKCEIEKRASLNVNIKGLDSRFS
jgi:hypothetical protein